MSARFFLVSLVAIAALAQVYDTHGVVSSDFDFLVGSWKVHNRYLKGRLQGSMAWIEFEGQSEMQLLPNGLGNVDRYTFFREDKRIDGVALRLFKPNNQSMVDILGRFDQSGRNATPRIREVPRRLG